MKKKIMFILPSLCGGGAEKTIANLSFSLSKNYDIYIVAFRDVETKYSFEGNYIYISNKKSKGILDKFIFAIKAYLKIKKIKKENNIDYSISFLATADFINLLAKTKHTKNIVSIRNTDSMNHTGTINYYLTKYSCKKADHIVAISEQVKLDIVESFKVDENKITTIYNPAMKIDFGNEKCLFDAEFFKEPVFINIGRLTKQKGQWHLIKAFSLVVKKHSNAKLIILGQGELFEDLKKLINDLNLEKNVHLMGFVDNPYDYLTKSRCFVFSSLYEGLGNSILESLCCSVPVISTDCISGPREILAPETDWKVKVKGKVDYAKYGILTPGFDSILDINDKTISREEVYLAEAIEKIIEDNNLYKYYKEKSIERSKDFDIKNITEQWENTLKKCD